ncbi:hypothetical protein MOE86_15620 [Bacillus atrophaeus]|uniref:hypothetical protein n=1 Tax=Bacillus atrophaeus TaxID=1452 RepID=UPI002282AC31|nr:hypothetical protein [Bacillus atrophaeus]MCY9198107.1 hypothetical protein [Bacillus atrophaeus]
MKISDYVTNEGPIYWQGEEGQRHSWIDISKSRYKLSVQGSITHYSTPRENIHIDEYEAYEVTFLYPSFFGTAYCRASSALTNDFKRLEELDKYFVEYDGYIAKNVPKELVLDLIRYIKGE